MKKISFLILLSFIILFQIHCPHKPIDPGTLATKTPELFSLPAPVTSGSIEFEPQMYLTSGLHQLETYDKTGYDGRKYTFNYVGAQIQFMSFKKSDGTVGYKPKWVISGGYSQDSINDKKNIIIISILPAFDTEDYECSNPSDPTASNFCDNYLSSGGIFDSYNGAGKDFYSYEANKYPVCSYQEIVPYDPEAYGLDDETSAPPPYDPVTQPKPPVAYCEKEKWYDGTNLKKYNVVIEFIDSDGNLFTSKFPYNNDLDNQGNHTPIDLMIKNFPDPSLDPNNFASSETDENKNIWTDITAPSSDQTVNCTGLQQGVDCSNVLDKINLTISNSSNVDDDIIHKMQLAGKEFRALGTDLDPRYEFMINNLFFNVKRGPNSFYDEKE